MIADSELILNPDGSVYHLHLLPEDISDTIVTVGDPNRVKIVSSFFDSIEIRKEKREFFTHTGVYKGKRITVLSTGIGTDNIDIVFNELDALVNIDLQTRKVKDKLQKLKIVRIGTSGCMDETIPIDSTLLSSYGLGMDGLLNYYEYGSQEDLEVNLKHIRELEMFKKLGIEPYLFEASTTLVSAFFDSSCYKGITATCTGFYGPQGRQLRLRPKSENLIDSLKQIEVNGEGVTNFEMETAAIYGLAKLLGHEALSVNLLIANRERGEFSQDPKGKMLQLIEWSLDKLAAL